MQWLRAIDIINILKTGPEFLTVKSLSECLPTPPTNAVRQALESAYRRGFLVKEGRKGTKAMFYSLAEDYESKLEYRRVDVLTELVFKKLKSNNGVCDRSTLVAELKAETNLSDSTFSSIIQGMRETGEIKVVRRPNNKAAVVLLVDELKFKKVAQ